MLQAEDGQNEQHDQEDEHEEDEHDAPQFQHVNPNLQGFQEEHGFNLGQLQQDLSAMQVQQTQFFENFRNQQAQYMQQYMQEVQEQIQEVKESQVQYSELIHSRKLKFDDYYSATDFRIQKQQQEINDLRKQFAESTRSSAAREAYCCWALQQTNPNLAPISVTNIPTFMNRNATQGRGLFEGALWPQPVGESSERDKGKAPLEKDTARDPNADSDDE
ncbi:hypothetical protein PIB30_102683 [Stylosanthes scabra]|uniref:Uncharacterized protein n=1 Tax=Stylosanthes scabra TaxID=79078 RepID=A0ABU6WXN7_9FABA|nr:hypothetical protein [Stylosanthes scabra]